MKKVILLLICLISIFAKAQTTVNISTSDYDNLKINHQLDATKHYIFTDALSNTIEPPVNYHSANRLPSSICSCMIPRDASFSVALPRSDDGSTTAITIPFAFNFYGTNYTQLYINNNGNVTFTTAFSTYTGTSFPSASLPPTIAPFWSDVDTRNVGSGLVYYKITPTAIIIKWDSVGYFSYYIDKLNTFQMVITDGTDPLLPAGDNVGFCYGDMQWTTGDASAGVGGFGGMAATVGVNKGDGINFFQVGTFNLAGATFDGPYGANDGIDWLDNQGMYFNTATSGLNIPPVIINNNICDTIDVYTGDTTHTMLIDSVQFKIGISTPEIGQTVTTTLTSSMPSKFSYIQTINTATYEEYICKFNVTSIPEGLYFIYINAIDNGVPIGTSNKTIVIRSHYDAGLASTVGIQKTDISDVISIYPNPTSTNFTITSTEKIESVRVFNLLGEEVLTTTPNNTQSTININQFSKGIYFVEIKTKSNVRIQRIILN